MAALWQLGVQHVQGYLIQSPEEVVIGGTRRRSRQDGRPDPG